MERDETHIFLEYKRAWTSLTYWLILKGPQNQHNQGVAQRLEQISNSYFTQFISSFVFDASELHDGG